MVGCGNGDGTRLPPDAVRNRSRAGRDPCARVPGGAQEFQTLARQDFPRRVRADRIPLSANLGHRRLAQGPPKSSGVCLASTFADQTNRDRGRIHLWHGKEVSMRKAKTTSGRATSRTGRYWSAAVTRHSDAITIAKGVFRRDDPNSIARSLKRAVEHSNRRKSTPSRSAISLLNSYINRAGKHLPARRRNILERAKGPLRGPYGT